MSAEVFTPRDSVSAVFGKASSARGVGLEGSEDEPVDVAVMGLPSGLRSQRSGLNSSRSFSVFEVGWMG